MPTFRRTVTLIILLAGATAALLVSGGLWNLSDRLFGGLTEPWQATIASAEPVATEEEVRERMIRMNVENIILRRRLAEYAAIKDASPVPMPQVVVARGQIMARTLRQGRRYCEVAVGAVDGVNIGDIAVLGWSVVGKVVGIGPGRCLVQTIADSESRIPAALFDQDACIAEGVVRGTGNSSVVLLDMVEDRPGLNVVAGQNVVTAGLNGLIPGLVIGTVIAAQRGETADHWQIEVQLLRSLDTVESVVLLAHDSAVAK